MIGVIAEHLKTHRHQLGKHALFIGSAVKIPPKDQLVLTSLERMALKWAGDRVADLEGTEQVLAALDLMAAEVTDHRERCRLLREEVGEKARPAEGHVRLSRLVKDGYYSTIFVSEPDDMLERALHAQHLEPDKDYHLLVGGLDDPEEINVALAESTRPALVKCGGDWTRDFLPLSRAEISRIAGDMHKVIQESFKIFSVFVAMTEREDAFLAQVPKEGARIFWINTLIPMANEELYDELRIENPASAEYHRYQPHVIELLEARHSSRHLLCREPGSFNEFAAKLHTRLVRQRHTRRGQKYDLTVLRGGPYRFLDHFDVEDGDFYFGREDDVKAVMEKIQTSPITVVFGQAAIGKTSLLRAGVMAALKRESEEADKTDTHPWLVAYTRVGEEPIASIRAAILNSLEQLGYEPGKLAQTRSLCDVVKKAAELTGRQIIVLLDQFAEFHVKLGDKTKEKAREALRACFDNCGDQFRMVLAIREDFVGELYEMQSDFPTIMHNMHRLHKFTPEQAADAIIKPAQNFELQVKRTLVERIVEDLNREGIEPAQLEIVCHSIYEARSKGSHFLGERLYDELGGAQQILDKYLERALNLLLPPERRVAAKMLIFIAGGSELKLAQPVERIAAEAEADRELVERVLARLVDMGLLRPVGRGRRREYELVHEILADKIQTDLAGKQPMTRDVQDLLTREMNNAAQFGLLIPPEELRMIDQVRDELLIGPDELKLLIRSALTQEQETDYWFERVIELGDDKGEFLAQLMRDEAPQVRLKTYEKLGDHLEPRLIRHLVHGLDDDQAEVRTLATGYLGQLEGHLEAMLENRDYRVRALAARSLGRTGSRRLAKALTDSFLEGVVPLRDELTAALIAIDEPRAPAMLLRSVSAASESAWSAAYALGRVSIAESDLKALEKAAKGKSRPELSYALGVAYTFRRSFPEAGEALSKARESAQEEIGTASLDEADRELRRSKRRAAAGVDAWPMFGQIAAHGAMTMQQVTPPLEIAWEFVTKDQIVASPVVRDNTVYIGSRDKRLYAIDTGKGTARWSFDAPERIESAAALSQELVCFGTLSGSVHGVDVASGEQRWKVALDGPVRSSCVIEGDGLYVGTRAGEMVRLDVATGKEAWKRTLPGEISAAAAVYEDLVLVGCWDAGIHALSAADGSEVWVFKAQAPVSSSPAVAEGTVYCGTDDHGLYALSTRDGELIWRADLKGQVRSSAALTEELVIVGSTDGKCYAVSRATGEIAWAAETAEEIMAAPSVSGEFVYIGSRDGALYALSVHDGEIVWRHQTAYGLYSAPAIAEQTVFVGLDYYNLAAFRPRAELGVGKKR